MIRRPGGLSQSSPCPESSPPPAPTCKPRRDSRPRILTDNFTAYRVEQGGKGEGTIFAYHFAAGGRERDYRLHVSESAGGLQEQDQMSSFVSTWTVVASRAGSLVTIESSWDGAGGIGGFFGAMISKYAPVQGGHTIQLSQGEEK